MPSAFLSLYPTYSLFEPFLANFPDPVTISTGRNEILDVFAKYEHDSEAYGWNNEAYLNNWRTARYKMVPGNYKVVIEVTSENGAYCKKSFKAHVASTIEDTYLHNINSRQDSTRFCALQPASSFYGSLDI